MKAGVFAQWLSVTLATTTELVVASVLGVSSNSSCSRGRTNRFLTVSTSNGAVTGHIAPGTSCVIEYLGIPYAKPPVGELRFAAPQPIGHQQPYTAANFGFDCPQTASGPSNFPGLTPQAQRIIDYFASGTGNPQDEDCLTLNIWSKPTAKAAAADKPVLIFLYGGRKFCACSGCSYPYLPDLITKCRVVAYQTKT